MSQCFGLSMANHDLSRDTQSPPTCLKLFQTLVHIGFSRTRTARHLRTLYRPHHSTPRSIHASPPVIHLQPIHRTTRHLPLYSPQSIPTVHALPPVIFAQPIPSDHASPPAILPLAHPLGPHVTSRITPPSPSPRSTCHLPYYSP